MNWFADREIVTNSPLLAGFALSQRAEKIDKEVKTFLHDIVAA